VSDVDLVGRAWEATGYRFRDTELLVTSLTHSSIANSRVESNERLEFLGDAVLGMVVCVHLYDQFDHWLEGDLTKSKSVLVSRRVCASISDDIGLTDLLILGNGIDAHQNLPLSLRAAVLEAVIGAIYLDGGLEPARDFILRVVQPHLDKATSDDHHGNFKSSLQHYVQRHLAATPHYESLDEQGPDHSKCFEVCVVIDGNRYPSAWGPTKKAAEQEAARRAMEILSSSRHEDRHRNAVGGEAC